PGPGSCTERENLSPRHCPRPGWRGREGVPQAGHAVRGRVPSRGTGADRLVVVTKPGNAGGAKGTGHPGLLGGQPAGAGRNQESEPRPKPFDISKHVVFEAYRRVKANKGAAGVDEQSMAAFEVDLKGNLYKLWNRMSSGSYIPPPVKMVEIPKPGGKGV